MPRPLVFIPCERVATSDDTATSLLGILQAFAVAAEVANDPQVQEAQRTLPLRWDIAAIWFFTDEEVGSEFESICELVTPSGKISFKGVLPLNQGSHFQRNTFHITGFPIAEAGTYNLKLFLRKKGEDSRQEMAVYPIQISHVPGAEILSQFKRVDRQEKP